MTDPVDILARFRSRLKRRARLCRSITIFLIGLGVFSLVHIIAVLLRLSGWSQELEWTSVIVSSCVVLMGAIVALSMFLPVGETNLLRNADRLLALDGALVTAMEVCDASDPISKLLVRRTATAITGIRSRVAVPLRVHGATLLVPAIVILAFGLEAYTDPSVGTQSEKIVNADVRDFSKKLQEAASMLLADRPAASPQIVRHLLDIDSALLRGEINLDQARSALAEWLKESNLHADKIRQPGSPGVHSLSGDTNQADARARPRAALDILEVLALRKTPSDTQQGILTSSGSVLEDIPGDQADLLAPRHGAGVGGRGEGAGLGSASWHDNDEVTRPTGLVYGKSTWILPRPQRLTGFANTGSPIDPQNQEYHGEGFDRNSRRLDSSSFHLTASEHLIVDAYFRALFGIVDSRKGAEVSKSTP